MNIFINTVYMDDITRGEDVEKRFPLIYFWLKDYYYQRSPENFKKVNDWSFSDDPTPLRENIDLQKRLFDTPPDIVGLSLYFWNEEVLLENARWIKENFPKCLIIAAGPSADSREEWMKKHTHVDIVIPGPAAESFRRVVDLKLKDQDVLDVAGVNYWNGTKAIRNAPVPRHADPLVLDYVNNFRDEVVELLDEYTQKYEKVIFLTFYMQGCPYSCSFCEQGTKLWTKVLTRDIEKVYSEIDLLATYKNCVYAFADANFGIVPAYEDIVDYVIEKGKGNIKFKKPQLAKNQVDFTNHLMRKMMDGGVYYSDAYGVLTLQDPNPEIVKMNGRPFSKEYEKMKAYREFTKDVEYKTGHVEIIMGMPGQSFDSLTDSLNELLKNDLLSAYPPYFYSVFANTTLTSPGNTYQFKANKVYVRSERGYSKGLIDHLESDCGLYYNIMVETETLSTHELAGSWYHWSLMNHAYGFLGWMRTPLEYLKNYHGVSSHDFIKEYAKQFNPSNWKNLPESFRLDIEALSRWFSGEDRLYDRLDNSGAYALTPRLSSKYRFHSNPKEFIGIMRTIISNLIDIESDPQIEGLLGWQLAKILPIDEHDRERKNHFIGYNFDDIARCRTTRYWKSDWEFVWPKENIYQKNLNMLGLATNDDSNDIQYVPTPVWNHLDNKFLQKELILPRKAEIHDTQH